MKTKVHTVKQLFKLYSEIIEELRNRGVVRSSNNPVADYAEYLACKDFKLSLVRKSQKSYDCVDKNNLKYQVKARRNTQHNTRNQLGVIRSLDFDYLLVYIFNHDFTVKVRYKISIDEIRKLIKDKVIKFSKHQNGYITLLNTNFFDKYIIKKK